MTSAFGKKEKGCCLHEELLSGVRQTATLIAKRKVRQDSNTKLPFAGLVNIVTTYAVMRIRYGRNAPFECYLPACVEYASKTVSRIHHNTDVGKAFSFQTLFYRFRVL